MGEGNNHKGRVALITGGSAGIGKATAIKLAHDGFTLLLVGRDAQRGQAAVDVIREHSKHAQVHYLQADMSLMRDVYRLARVFKESYKRLDILIHSAGVIHTKRILTAEGLEATFATDYLSRFYLTTLLLDLLKATPAARMVNVAGAGSGMGQIDFGDVLGERKIGGMRGLGQAQFANDVFTVELARRLKGAHVTVNVMHPGAVDTDIRKEFPKIVNMVLGTVFKPFAMTAEQGAEAPYFLATSEMVKNVSGGLFKRKKQITPSERTLDGALGKQLWEVSERLIEEVMKEITI